MTKTHAPRTILLAILLAGPVLAADPAPPAAAPAAVPPAAMPPATEPPAAVPPIAVPPAAMPPATVPPVTVPPATVPKTAVPKTGPAPAPEASLTDLVRALSQFLTEEEVQLVYDYLWDASIASLKGTPDDVSLPPELAFKLAILQRRIVKEGGFYLEGLARKMEKDLANWQQNMMTPPPPPTYSLPSERNQAAPANRP